MRLHLEDGERVRLLARLGLPETTSESDLSAAVQTRLFVEGEPSGEGTTASTSTESRTESTTNGSNGSTTASAASGTDEAPQTDESGTSDLPEGDDVVVLDVEAYNRLQARSREADGLREQARVDRRDNLIAAAVRTGKIPPSRGNHYRARYDDDPEDVTARINRMPNDVIPMHERGVDAQDEDIEARDAYPSEWLSERSRAAARVEDSKSLSSRVHSEE